MTCKNYLGELKCVAFPDGIPTAILTEEFDHTNPYKEGEEQDFGVLYEPLEGIN
jgi:hypothetical protein